MDAARVRFVDSVSDGFTNALNRRGGSYCNQDGYEILCAAFGSGFDEARLRAATSDECRAMADELMAFGELADGAEMRRLLDTALRQWSGSVGHASVVGGRGDDGADRR